MKIKGNKKAVLRKKRCLRVRKGMKGTELKPRLSVRKTNRHIFVQLIDDNKGNTLASISTMHKTHKQDAEVKKNKETAKRLGAEIAEMALKKDIKEAIFDRGFSKYHGIIAELATAAREKGLKI